MLASLTRASARVLRTPHAATVARPLTRVTPARRAFSSEDRPAPSEKKKQNSAPQPTDGVPHPESAQRAPEIPFPGRKRGEKPVLWLASLPRAKTEADLKEELKATIAGVTRVDIPMRNIGYNKGYAFVHFDTPENMALAKEKLTEEPLKIGAKRIIVQDAVAPTLGTKAYSTELAFGHVITDMQLRSLVHVLPGLRQITTNRIYRGDLVMVASASLYFNTPDSRAQAEKTIKTLTELDGMPVRIDLRSGRPYIYGISKGAEEGEVEKEGELGVKQEKRRQAQRAPEDHGKRDDEQRREGGGKRREGRGEAPGGGALAGEVTRNEAAESGAPIEAVPSSEPATPSTRGAESQAQPSESAPVPPSPAAEALPAKPEVEVKLEASTSAPEAPIPTESSPAPAELPKP